MGKSEDDITPFNGTYHMKHELVGHQKGVRYACNINSEYLSLLITDEMDGSALSDLEYLVTGGTEGEIIVWKFNKYGDCDIVTRFMGHVNTVMCICPSRLLNDYIDMSLFDENTSSNLTITESKLCIFTCGRDKLIHRFNLLGKKLLTLEGHEDVVCSLHEPEDYTKLISGSWDGTAIVWNVLSGTKEYVLPCNGYQYSVYVNSLPNGNVVTAMQNGDLCVWNGTKLVKSDKVHKDVVRAISVHNDNLATCSNDTTVKIFNHSLSNLLTINAHESFVYGMSITKLVGTTYEALSLLFAAVYTLSDVRHSRRFGVLYSSSEDKFVRIWDPSTGALLQSIALESSVWQVVEMTHNGLVTVELSGNLILWELKSGKSDIPAQVSYVCSTNNRVEQVYDMTLYRKFNNAKALELLQKYNVDETVQDKLSDREMVYLVQLINKDPAHVNLSSVEVQWMQKLLKWPVSFRLPVFDLLKSLAVSSNTEPLFKGRNNGSNVIISACAAFSCTDNIPLITVALQLFSNLLLPSLSKALMICHHDRIFKSISSVLSIENRMVQSVLSAFCQNYIIAILDNKNVKTLINNVIESIEASLNACKDVSPDNQWLEHVVLKHALSLEILFTNIPSSLEVIRSSRLKELLLHFSTRLNLKGKLTKVEHVLK